MMTDCVVVGAGPAGLASSAALTQRGIDHVILERGQAGDTWRTQRWDSFRLNTAAWMNQMLEVQERYAYAYRAEVVQKLEQLARNTPIRTGVRVARLAPAHDGYRLQTSDGRGPQSDSGNSDWGSECPADSRPGSPVSRSSGAVPHR